MPLNLPNHKIYDSEITIEFECSPVKDTNFTPKDFKNDVQKTYF